MTSPMAEARKALDDATGGQLGGAVAIIAKAVVDAYLEATRATPASAGRPPDGLADIFEVPEGEYAGEPAQPDRLAALEAALLDAKCALTVIDAKPETRIWDALDIIAKALARITPATQESGQ